MKQTVICCLLAMLTSTTQVRAQQIIHLNNPSFEDKPRCCDVPRGWVNLGPKFESPPDIQPGAFQVELPAFDGATYLGLATRDNETWESVGQELSDWLYKDSTYSFELYLARDPRAIAFSRTLQDQTSFAQAVVLRIWGYNTNTQVREMLAQTVPVVNKRWILYKFTLQPRETDYNRIELEAYYDDDNAPPYNGMLLIDACSPITQTSN